MHNKKFLNFNLKRVNSLIFIFFYIRTGIYGKRYAYGFKAFNAHNILIVEFHESTIITYIPKIKVIIAYD